MFKDSLGILHETDARIDVTRNHFKIFELAWWASPKGPKRVRGPRKSMLFDVRDWKLGNNPISLDTLSISEMTRALTHRKFIPPIAEKTWKSRLQIQIPWPKIWKIRSPFVAPRDQIPFLKVQHRNLYVAARNPDPNARNCVFWHICKCEESIRHLAECPVIFSKYWKIILALLNDFEIEDPADPYSFILLGRVDDDSAANHIQATFLYLAWRCLYATLVGEHADDKKASLNEALTRFASMLISRIQAYGLKWRTWSNKNRNTGKLWVIPERHRDKVLVKQEFDGTYHISEKLTDFYKARREALKQDRQ